jgi:uracil phosphoribosyltransferase
MKKFLCFLLILPFVILSQENFINCNDNPIISNLVYTIRNPSTNRKTFRKSLKKIGEFLSYEISKELEVQEKSIKTLMGSEAVEKEIISKDVVLITILRAGVPFFNGLLSVFADSDCGFFGMMRDEKTLKAKIDYIAIPDITINDIRKPTNLLVG